MSIKFAKPPTTWAKKTKVLGAVMKKKGRENPKTFLGTKIATFTMCMEH